jgi:hypothetical protein
MKNAFIKLTIISMMLSAIVGTSIAQTGGPSIPGSTIAIVNLRSGPGTRFDVVAELANETPLVFVGRNASNTWLQVDANGLRGWLSYTFVEVDGRVNDLPLIDANGVPAPSQNSQPAAEQEVIPQSAGGPPANAPTNVVPQITSSVRQIFLHGRQLGNHPDIFAKVGDSITATDLFLDPIGQGGLQLYDYEYLRPVVQYFSQSPARDHNSFANTSLAARSGWSSNDVLDPSKATTSYCAAGETPLECEYRILQPSVALIMLGTNDLPWMDSGTYQANMRRIVEISLDHGVIPVLSTIPDQLGSPNEWRVAEFNQIITNISYQYGVPLWNYWLALQNLPNRGLGGDNVHPSYDYTIRETAIFSPDMLRYGYNVRNLTALMVLDAIWRGAMY